MSFHETSLWKNAFEGKEGSEKEKADKLRLAFLDFRNNAAHLANEVPKHLPGLTVHDITHLDALWEMACLIAGPDLILTPTEAFVLGGAFLTHDLAMSIAAYPEGFKEIKETDQWKDLVHKYLAQKLGRQPVAAELVNPEQEVIEKAQQDMLRNLHAIQAEKLATQKWSHERLDYDQFLIDNTELRQDFGTLIGKLAHSHWWSIEKVEKEFPHKVGAPGHLPTSWDIDPLRLACLLRVADASHVDDRRAPTFLYAIRKPEGVSLDHWNFQYLLNRPILNNDRLQYTSKRPFRLKESTAWWLCFDTLTMIDRELRQVDSLLAKKGFRRLLAKGVQGIENADYLKQFIGVDAWEPVDTRIKVSDVAKLAKNLGGKQLYGTDELVPLRELIQNASDAVRARRKLEYYDDFRGKIVVRIGKSEKGNWLEIEDNGIGMSSEVLKGAFLDFGTSYWGSSLMMQEWPGLLARGFESTGRFGIGFFSVFMWSNKIEVKTRKLTEGRSETFILTFFDGLNSRPVLRKASRLEQMRGGGTVIRIYLESDFDEISTAMKKYYLRSFKDLCAWLCPTLDIDLLTQVYEDAEETALTANDWLELDASRLSVRLRFWNSEITYKTLKSLFDVQGKVVGRLSLNESSDGTCVTVGGLRSSVQRGTTGFLLGRPITARRNEADILLTRDCLVQWAKEQSKIFSKLELEGKEASAIAAKLIDLTNDPGDLVFALTPDGWVTKSSIASWIDAQQQIMLLDIDNVGDNPYYWEDLDYDIEGRKLKSGITLDNKMISDNLLAYPTDSCKWLKKQVGMKTPKGMFRYIDPEYSTVNYIVELISSVWKIDVETLVKNSNEISVSIGDPENPRSGFTDDTLLMFNR